MARGAVTLEELVKFIPHIILAVLAIVIFVTLYGIFFKKPLSEPEKDLKRATAELLDLQPNAAFAPLTLGKDYTIVLIKPSQARGSMPGLTCRNQGCFCVTTNIDAKTVESNPQNEKHWVRCEILKPVRKDCGTGSKDLCITATSAIAIKPADRPSDARALPWIILCRKENQLYMVPYDVGLRGRDLRQQCKI